MRLPAAAAIIIILCISGIIFPQDYYPSSEFFADANYAEAPLQKGLPETEPGKEYPLKLRDPYFAWINPVYGFLQIFFIKGFDAGNREKYFILTVSPSEGSTLNPVEILTHSGNELYGYSYIGVTLQSAFSFPLKLSFSGSGSEIKYSWPPDVSQGNNIQPVPVIKIGDKLNPSSLPLKDNNIKPEDLKNKRVILIWRPDSSRAGNKSVSDFNSLYKKYEGNPNTVFISVGNDKNMRDKKGNYYQIKPDSKTASYLGEYSPLTLIADSTGKIIYSRLGYNKSYSDIINKILSNYKTH